jgi:hypothetical protein
LNAHWKCTLAEWLAGRFAAKTTAAVIALTVMAATSQAGYSQSATSEPAPNYSVPEPIYWKQTLFQIPYHWSSAAEPGAADVVWLLVSKDRGATWIKISEAKPNVTSFNYRAEGDGEYWFAVRTIDRQGRPWPAGEYRPELRVIVDTTIPRIEQLHAARHGTGDIELAWSGRDSNLDPGSWKFESQTDPNGSWHPMAVDLAIAGGGLAPTQDGYSGGRATSRSALSAAPIAVRATVADRAGNSATFHTEVRPAANGIGAITRLPAPALAPLGTNQPVVNPFVNAALSSSPQPSSDLPIATPTQGWTSASDAMHSHAQPQQPVDQTWSASALAHVPFRLWSGAVGVSGDGVTSYGTPAGADSLQMAEMDAKPASSGDRVSAQYAVADQTAGQHNASHTPSHMESPPFRPLEPYRQSSETMPPNAERHLSGPASDAEPLEGNTDSASLPPTNAYANPGRSDVEAKLVGSRTFALEYDLEDAGRWGVSKVELWGTRDSGQSWRLYTQDDDQRSPLVVTVDEEGLYGFRIVVDSANSSAVARPQPGDTPELWVAVDLQQPVAELTAIERGTGNAEDQLILHWRAEDDNLGPRPVAVYYSSRLNGPWSAVATNLENTGHYAWRIERHVPERFYLRLEVRDAAGNLAAFRTREPIEFAAAAPSARLNAAESIVPSSTGGASYR